MLALLDFKEGIDNEMTYSAAMMQTPINACVGSLSLVCLYNTNIPTCFTTCTHPVLFVAHPHTLTHTHLHTLTYTPSHMQTFTHIHTFTHSHTHPYILTFTHTYTFTHSQMHTFTHLYLCTRNSLGDGHPSVYCCKPLGCCHTDV